MLWFVDPAIVIARGEVAQVPSLGPFANVVLCTLYVESVWKSSRL